MTRKLIAMTSQLSVPELDATFLLPLKPKFFLSLIHGSDCSLRLTRSIFPVCLCQRHNLIYLFWFVDEVPSREESSLIWIYPWNLLVGQEREVDNGNARIRLHETKGRV